MLEVPQKEVYRYVRMRIGLVFTADNREEAVFLFKAAVSMHVFPWE